MKRGKGEVASIDDLEFSPSYQNYQQQLESQPFPPPPRHQQPIPSIDLAVSLHKHLRYDDAGYATEPQQHTNVGILPSAAHEARYQPRLLYQNSEHPEKKNRLHMFKPCVRYWPDFSQPMTLLTVFVLLWAVGYSVLPRQLIDPSSPFMRMWFLFIGAHLTGALVSLVGLHDMIGSLAWGVLYGNIGLADFEGLLDVENFMRDLSLVNIMLVAGLGVDYDALKKHFRFILQLAIIPTVVEVSIITLLSFYLLKLPWLWGVLLGLAVTAIAPNVAVTVMVFLKQEQLGLNKGIRTMVICMTDFNDYLTKCMFGIVVGVMFSTGDLTNRILQAPTGIAIALTYGGLCGVALNYLPSYQARHTNALRFTFMLIAGTLAVFGSQKIGYPATGAIGAMATSIVAGTGWKKRPDYEQEILVGPHLTILWKFLKPVSFALVGKEIKFAILTGNTVLYGASIIVVAILFRLVCVYICTLGTDLNRKEKAFVMVSALPKATVQAALAPVALEVARSLNAVEEYERAHTVLVVTILSIILTTPLGAFLMIKLAPRCLVHGPPPPRNES